MGPRKPCSIGKALGKQTDLLHVSPMSAKNLLLSVPGAWCVHPMYTTHAHNRCLREMHLTFFSVAHFHQCTMTMDCEWRCVIESACHLLRTALCPKPFTALLLQKPVPTYEATEHGLHHPGVELVYHIYTGDRWNWGNVGRSLKPLHSNHMHTQSLPTPMHKKHLHFAPSTPASFCPTSHSHHQKPSHFHYKKTIWI